MRTVLDLPETATPRGVCAVCGDRIYSSGYRRHVAPDDPWVHEDWGRREFDHAATPRVQRVTLTVDTWLDPKQMANAVRGLPGVTAATATTGGTDGTE